MSSFVPYCISFWSSMCLLCCSVQLKSTEGLGFNSRFTYMCFAFISVHPMWVNITVLPHALHPVLHYILGSPTKMPVHSSGPTFPYLAKYCDRQCYDAKWGQSHETWLRHKFRNNVRLLHYRLPCTNTPTMPAHSRHCSKKLASSTMRVYSGLCFGGSRSSKVLTTSQVQQQKRCLEEKMKKEENHDFQHIRY